MNYLWSGESCYRVKKKYSTENHKLGISFFISIANATEFYFYTPKAFLVFKSNL